ncbi:hypothetical protein [Ferruginibacter sp.]|nr:hypothetical protein [Ferruginibacter sp.]
MQKIITLLFCFTFYQAFSQDSSFLKVHFLYGSRPLHKNKGTEQKWFGGVKGGHVGIEADSGRIVNFVPNGKFHWFAKKNSRHSRYAIHTQNSFYSILGGHYDSAKRTVVIIPVTQQQKQHFDSITAAYLKQTPYDYALIGMRCGAAAYEILAQLKILQQYSYAKTYRKIFYPKKLRKRLLKKAAVNGWVILQQPGSSKRKWEKD